MPTNTPCVGCGKSDTAPKHRSIVPGVPGFSDDVEVGFHYDCHHIVTKGACLLCAHVIATHPELKDAELGAALEANFPLHPELVAAAEAAAAESEA